MKPAVIVHGGAWDIPDNLWEAHKQGCKESVERGFSLLSSGASAVDIVEECVKILELNPVFDAGKGSFLNIDGKIEMDAGIMDGRKLDCGSVAAIEGILHPICVARKVMEETEHVLLAGAGADLFAEKMGFKQVPYEELLVGRELERWLKIKDDPNFKIHTVFDGNNLQGYNLEGKELNSNRDTKSQSDTVGAVAVDKKGNIAAATSTGGTPKKMTGRVGDSPLIGCGLYADNGIGGASGTGWGEQLIKVCFCKTAIDFLSAGHDSMMAAEMTVKRLSDKVGGKGGIILADKNGNIGFAYNTPRMAFDYREL